ncbi:hypothetical protein BC937DRAFT_90723, partial [Endogone sp. FLAS-F59071]
RGKKPNLDMPLNDYLMIVARTQYFLNQRIGYKILGAALYGQLKAIEPFDFLATASVYYLIKTYFDSILNRHEPTGHELANLSPCLMKLDISDILCGLYEESNNTFRSRHAYIRGWHLTCKNAKTQALLFLSLQSRTIGLTKARLMLGSMRDCHESAVSRLASRCSRISSIRGATGIASRSFVSPRSGARSSDVLCMVSGFWFVSGQRGLDPTLSSCACFCFSFWENRFCSHIVNSKGVTERLDSNVDNKGIERLAALDSLALLDGIDSGISVSTLVTNTSPSPEPSSELLEVLKNKYPHPERDIERVIVDLVDVIVLHLHMIPIGSRALKRCQSSRPAYLTYRRGTGQKAYSERK